MHRKIPSVLQQENGVFDRKTAGSYVSTLERFRKASFSPSTQQYADVVFESIHFGKRFRQASLSVTEDAGLVWTKDLTVSKSIRFQTIWNLRCTKRFVFSNKINIAVLV